ncbi:MAG TPA: ABC transporter permease, partial [bacterium]|nr:ABC transporter permease [bacterium]
FLFIFNDLADLTSGYVNFLIRIFAWKFILHPDGIIKQILVFFNLASDNTLLLYRWETVLLVLIYTHLPFALLPIYAAAEKFDFLLFDAAYDLGASKIQTFYKIFIPGISGGIIASTLVVFIPCLGSYVIPDIVGGTDSEMLGNKIARYAFTDRNLPMASALSAILILAVVIPAIFKLFKKTEETAESINTQMI